MAPRINATDDSIIDPQPTIKQKFINLISWNINSIFTIDNQNKLLAILRDKKPDIFLLQETLWKPGTANPLTFFLNDYKLHWSFYDQPAGKRGLITAVKKTIPSIRGNKALNAHIEELNVIITTATGAKIEIHNIYHAHQVDDAISFDITDAKHMLFIGDFNAKHRLWSPGNSNERGDILSTTISHNDFILLNHDTISTTNNTNIDLCIASSDMAPHVDYETLGYVSDVHHPLHIDIKFQNYIDKKDFTPQFKLDEADWVVFSNAVDSKILQYNWKYTATDTQPDADPHTPIFPWLSEENLAYIQDSTPEKLDDILCKLIREAADEVIPKTKHHTHPFNNWFWTQKCSDAKRIVNRLHARKRKQKFFSQTLKTEILEAEQQLINTITEAKDEAWDKFCAKISLDKNDRRVWQSIKSIKNGGWPYKRNKDPDPKNSAQNLISQFQFRSSCANLTPEILHTIQNRAQTDITKITKALTEADPDTDEDINTNEIHNSFKTNTHSAPGEDGVCYKFLHNTGPIFKQLIQTTYNKVWKRRALCARWKRAKMIGIPKKGSPDKRPISLTAAIGKNLERIAKTRLENKIEAKMHPNLFGFRPKRGTADALATVGQKISKALYAHRVHRHARYCTAIFIDLEKAFELANPTIILSELAELGIKGTLLGYLQDYLSDRTGYVYVQGETSDTKTFENGVPQGGVLSPILFNVLINKLLQVKLPDYIDLYSYADDLILLCSAPNHEYIVQKALNILSIECRKLGLKINKTKTKSMEFLGEGYKRPMDRTGPHTYILDGSPVEYVKEYKYLGVILAPKLSLGKYANYISKKCTSRINILKCMSGLTWGTSPHTLIKYTNAAIRPILEFGSPIFLTSATPNSYTVKINALYRTCLRFATGLPKNTDIGAVYIETGTSPIDLRHRALTLNSITKLMFYDLDHPLHDDITTYIANYLFWFENRAQNSVSHVLLDKLMHMAKDIPGYLQLLDTGKHFDRIDIPLKFYTSLQDNIMIMELPSTKKHLSDSEKLIAKNTYDHMLNSHKTDHLIMCTDGSLNEDRTAGSFGVFTYFRGIQQQNCIAGFIPENGYTISSTATELTAIYHALKLANTLYKGTMTHNYSLLIVTDSKPAIQSITNNKMTDNIDVRRKILAELLTLYKFHIPIRFIWTPSHIGVWGNKQADDLASLSHLPEHKIPAIYKNFNTSIIQRVNFPIPPSIANYNKFYKDHLYSTWANSLIINYTLYHDFNPSLTKPNISHLPRRIQVTILKFRTNSFRKCPWQGETVCLHCNSRYSNNHYLWHCSYAEPLIREIDTHIPTSNTPLTDNDKTALVLSLEEESSYSILKKVFDLKPPHVGCTCNKDHNYLNHKPWETRVPDEPP